MADFATAVELGIEVDSGDLRSARRTIENGLGDVSVGVSGGGAASRATGGGGGGGGGRRGRRMFRWARERTSLLGDAVELLDSIEEKVGEGGGGSSLIGGALGGIGLRSLGGSVTTAAGAITGSVAASSLISGNLSAGALITGSVAASALITGSVAASALIVGTVATDSLLGGGLSAAAVITGTLAAGSLIVGSVAAATLIIGTVATGSLIVGTLSAAALIAGTIAAGSLIVGAVTAGSLIVGTIAIREIMDFVGPDEGHPSGAGDPTTTPTKETQAPYDPAQDPLSGVDVGTSGDVQLTEEQVLEGDTGTGGNTTVNQGDTVINVEGDSWEEREIERIAEQKSDEKAEELRREFEQGGP